MRPLALLFFVACSGSSPHQEPPTAAEPSSGSQSHTPACAQAPLASLLATASLEGELEGEAMEYSAQLDGEGERETILHARMLQGEPDNPMSAGIVTDHLVVFECRDGALSLAGSWTFDATPDNGTIDCNTGIRRVDMQRVAEREMLVVTTHQCQGSVDPRWDDERMRFLAYSGEGFDEVFSCAFREDHATGPCRSGASIRRRINISHEEVPTIQVSMERSFNPGTCENETPGPDEGDLSQEATYSWSGTSFVPSGEDVCR
ncbi:MAG: hypothetical protein AB8H86_03650 [Polyangiales bacterium]